jgi:transposase-like protein
MDIILGRARRTRSDEEKRAIVAETMIDGESVSGVARRHGVNVNMLFTWRRRFRLEDEAAEAGASGPDFVPVAIGDSVPVRRWPIGLSSCWILKVGRGSGSSAQLLRPW